MKTFNEVQWDDLYNLNSNELSVIADDIREFLITTIVKNGGHIGSSLGLIEVVVALMSQYKKTEAMMLFDTGHNSHIYKMLTQGWSSIDWEKKQQPVFQELTLNDLDYISTGHSSTSLSYLAGLQISDPDKKLFAIIGDAAMMNGVAFEGLLAISQSKTPVTIILNDNGEGIGINKLKAPKWKKYFESMNFNYTLIKEGNDLKSFKTFLSHYDDTKLNVIHIKTKKSYGFESADKNESNHFYPSKPFSKNDSQKILLDNLKKIVKDKNNYILNPGMVYAGKLEELLVNENFIDTGINEEHTLLLAAALASRGKKVFVIINSTFFQRAYDMFVHDVIRNKLPIAFIIDKACLQYKNGNSHHGIFDLSITNLFNEVIICEPSNVQEFNRMFEIIMHTKKTFALRNEKEILPEGEQDEFNIGDWNVVNDSNSNKILITYGNSVNKFKSIIEKNNYPIKLVNARFINPIDKKLLLEYKNCDLYVYEHVISKNNLATNIENFLNKKIVSFSFNSFFIGDGDENKVLKNNNMDYEGIIKRIMEV